MNERKKQVYQAAEMYYMNDMTMDAIALQLHISRPTVSRLLKEARESGVVRITLNDDLRPLESLEQRISNKYKVHTEVVTTRARATPISRMQQVAQAGAKLFDSLIEPGTIAGIAWGSTIFELSRHLPRRPVEGTTFVQLNGAGSASHSGIPYSGMLLTRFADAYQAKIIHFPVPAFFDHAQTKELMWSERSIQSVLALQKQADVAVFGVGAFGGAIPSHVYSGGYFTSAEQAELKAQGVVGDICTVLLTKTGEYQKLETNRRATGPTAQDLKKIKRRIAVATGTHRAQAVLAALRVGAITDLVIDDQLAEALLGL